MAESINIRWVTNREEAVTYFSKDWESMDKVKKMDFLVDAIAALNEKYDSMLKSDE